MLTKIFATIAVIVTGSLLLYGVSDFPAFGDPQSPANAGVEGGDTSVSQYYITRVYEDTKVPNLVTAVLADYRSYDTMLEAVVVFAAGMAIFAVLRVFGGAAERRQRPAEEEVEGTSFTLGDHQRIIVGTTCRLLVPVVQIFSLYVIAHGHHSPGGGFQGGVILGASFILVALAGDVGTALQRFSERNFWMLASTGILVYAGFGLACQFLGANFFDFGALEPLFRTDGPEMARSHSMLGVEVGVAFTVTAIMFAIYANLATRGSLHRGL